MSKEDDDSSDIKALLAAPADPPFDPDLPLQRVLAKARQQTTARDISSFFISWLWVLFAGFGASLHQAATRVRLRQSAASGQPRPPISSP